MSDKAVGMGMCGRCTFLPTCILSVRGSVRLIYWYPNRTGMLVLEFRQVVDIFIYYDPEIIGLVMRRDVILGECL